MDLIRSGGLAPPIKAARARTTAPRTASPQLVSTPPFLTYSTLGSARWSNIESLSICARRALSHAASHFSSQACSSTCTTPPSLQHISPSLPPAPYLRRPHHQRRHQRSREQDTVLFRYRIFDLREAAITTVPTAVPEHALPFLLRSTYDTQKCA